jgi:oleate hydratase
VPGLPRDQSKGYLIGAGIGSLSAAAFMIRDGNFRGENIVVLEASASVGGSLDAGGEAATGYSMRGGRMFTTDNYECTWGLFKDIPSLTGDGKSVYEETIEFNEKYRAHSNARLVDIRRAKVPVSSMGFSAQDRLELLKLVSADESALDEGRITDWLSPHFFETHFWFMWATTFAFQPWHSAIEFKRYLHRFMLEFSRIETLAGVKRTVYNQYDSMVRPLQKWLVERGVTLVTGCKVTAIEHRYDNGRFVVTGLECRNAATPVRYAVREEDLVILQNGSMTDDSTLGSMTHAPEKHSATRSDGWHLWQDLAQGRPSFGNPRAFKSCVAQSVWESFTITLKTPAFFDQMSAFTDNAPGTGGLVTFKDSNWLMSIVLAHQPHFLHQPAGVQVLWGYGLYPDRIGNFVAKPMDECSGADILRELCGHLRFDLEITAEAICIPCRMPYITSMFMPRTRTDRPVPVPHDSKNLGFVSQFVEIADDVVFTVEYSIRAAQMAVYSLLCIERPIPAVTPHDKSIRVRFDALVKAFE